MTLSELRASPHLSASSISDFIECGLLYKFSRVDKIPIERTSYNMVFGSAIHRTLEKFYQAKMNLHHKPLSLLLEEFEVEWKKACEENLKIQFYDGENFDSCLDRGKGLLTAFHQEHPQDNFQVLATENSFSFEIDGVDVPVIGAMDLIEQDNGGNIIITDFKTASKAYSRDDVDKSLQLTIYYLAAKINGFEDREILLRFDCLIKTKKPKFEQYYTSRNDEDIQRITKKIQSVWNGIQKGVFIPNDTSWKCGYCSYKKQCNAWFNQEENIQEGVCA